MYEGKFITLSGVRTMVMSTAYQNFLTMHQNGGILLPNLLTLPVERDFLDVVNQQHFLGKGPYDEAKSHFSRTLPIARAMRDISRFLYVEQYERFSSERSEEELEKMCWRIREYLTDHDDCLCKQQIVRAVKRFLENRDTLIQAYGLGNDHYFPAWEILWLFSFSVEAYETHVRSNLKRGVHVFGYLPLDSIHWELICGNNTAMKEFYKSITQALKDWFGTRQLFLEDYVLYFEVSPETAFENYAGTLLVEEGKARKDVFESLLKSFREGIQHSEHHAIIDGEQNPIEVAADITERLKFFSINGNFGNVASL